MGGRDARSQVPATRTNLLSKYPHLTSQLITDMTGGVMIARASASSDQGNMQTNYLRVQAGQGSGSGKIVDHSEPSVQLSHN